MHAAELEVLGAGARGDVDDAGTFVQRDLVPRDDAVLDLRRRRKIVERAAVRATHELLAAHPLHEFGVWETLDRVPLAVLVQPYSASGLTAAATFAGQRPGCRRPDDERLAFAVEQREANEERRVLELPVLAGVDLVL